MTTSAIHIFTSPSPSLSPSVGAMMGFHLAPQTTSPPLTLAWFQNPHDWGTVLLLLDPILPSGPSLTSPEADPEARIYLGGGRAEHQGDWEVRWEREGSDKRCCLLPWEPANATGAAWGRPGPAPRWPLWSPLSRKVTSCVLLWSCWPR